MDEKSGLVRIDLNCSAIKKLIINITIKFEKGMESGGKWLRIRIGSNLSPQSDAIMMHNLGRKLKCGFLNKKRRRFGLIRINLRDLMCVTMDHRSLTLDCGFLPKGQRRPGRPLDRSRAQRTRGPPRASVGGRNAPSLFWRGGSVQVAIQLFNLPNSI